MKTVTVSQCWGEHKDAHWCGGERVGRVECRLLDELRCIGGRRRDVTIIDNVGYLIHPPPEPHRPQEWPTMQEVLAVVAEQFPGAAVQLLWDQLIITPEPIGVVFETGHISSVTERQNDYWQ